jgi:hypothetical protein
MRLDDVELGLAVGEDCAGPRLGAVDVAVSERLQGAGEELGLFRGRRRRSDPFPRG